MAQNAIVAVVTKELNNANGQDTSYELLDGWLRPRQTQAPGPDGGRLITDTFHNAIGKTDRTYAAYYADGAPSTTLFGADTPGDVETQTAYTYDGLGRTTAERLLIGSGDVNEKWRTTYAYGGDWTTVTPPQGGTPTTTITDAQGRTVELRQHWTAAGPAGYSSTTYRYTPAGQLASVTGPGSQTWTHTYDLRGRKIETTDPDTGTTKYTYDDLDRLTQTEDARGKKIGVAYDGLGRKIAKYDATTASPGTKLAEWTYDTVRKGQPAASTRYVGTGAYTSKINYYDNLNRPTSTTLTLPASEGALAPAGGYTFTTAYNLDGTVKTSGFANAIGGLSAETLTYNYDGLGRPTTTGSTLSKYVINTDYSKTGKLLGRQMATADTGANKTDLTYTYETGTQRLKTATTVHDGTAGVDRDATYGYDNAGNITQITDVSRDGTDNQCFRYDYLRRLTDAWAQGDATCAADPATATLGGPAPYRTNYAYDVTGNRKTETQYGNGGVVTTQRDYKYAGDDGVGTSIKGHQLGAVTQAGAGPRTESYSYDASGNTTERTIGGNTQTLDWDNEGELAKISDKDKGETSYLYTADGDRLIRRDPAGTTLYLPGMEVRLDKGATTPKATRYYSHGGQTVAMRTSSGVTFLVGDHHSTSELAINASTGTLTRRRFSPFGQDRGTPTGTWPGEKGFVGGTIDASTDLTHLGAREYDPALGRFISVDPVFDPEHPQSWNGYTYSDNNPTTLSDPSGLCPPDRCGTGITNQGQTHPTMTGGCGLDCGKPPVPGPVLTASVKVVIGHTTIQAPSYSDLYSTYIKALSTLGSKDQHNGPLDLTILPNCKTGSTGIGVGEGACGPGDSDRLSNFAHFLCEMGGFSCKDFSAGQALKAGMVAFNPGMLGGEGPAGGRFSTVRGRSSDSGPIGLSFARGCNSFVTGTKVLLANGKTKPIEKIKIGDKVLATDPATGKISPKAVIASFGGESYDHLVQVTVAVRSRKDGVVIATEHHLFWDQRAHQWVRADQLKPGDQLRTPEGASLRVISALAYPGHPTVHDLTIADVHSFYVEAGTTPVLVHNCGIRPVGQFLESVDDVMANPRLLEGKTPAQVESMIGNTPGWQVGTMGKGRSAGQGWTFRQLNSRGTDFTDRYIQWHPGSRRHFGGAPYWKVSRGAGGTVRFPE
jgi:RHS repeat-associated protein